MHQLRYMYCITYTGIQCVYVGYSITKKSHHIREAIAGSCHQRRTSTLSETNRNTKAFNIGIIYIYYMYIHYIHTRVYINKPLYTVDPHEFINIVEMDMESYVCIYNHHH